MTLMQLCEPLFLYLCHLNRAGRNGVQFDKNTVRNEITNIFTEMQAGSTSDSQLCRQYERIEIPLKFFLDSMISESKLNIAQAWHKDRLAYSWKELAGDEKLFDLLDETLQETGDAATERLVIFYTCLGLGFQGFYAGKPDYLKKKMREIYSRIRKHVKLEQEGRVCPEAYENVDGRNLVEPPAQKVVGIVIAFVGLIVALFVTNAFLYRNASDELRKALRIIIAHDPAAPNRGTAVDKP